MVSALERVRAAQDLLAKMVPSSRAAAPLYAKRWDNLRDHLAALEADLAREEPITQEEAKAFLDLCDKPVTLLHVHGWDWSTYYTPADRRCATKLLKLAGREP